MIEKGSAEPPPPLTVPISGSFRFDCWSCGQPRRFVSQARPTVGGVAVRCDKCGAVLGEYAVDGRGWSRLRLALPVGAE